MSTNRKEIELDDEDKESIASEADDTGRHWKEILKERLRLLPRPTNASESALARAERLGLVGRIQAGATDLSTNKKYMEGFGGTSESTG